MKVLVVDDDVVSRMVLMHLIDGCGKFDIVEAEDGEDAWQQLAAGLRPLICFCDLRMPRLSGLELLQRAKAAPELAAMSFVLVSSATDHDTVQQATQMGATGYIVKPFQADQVRGHLSAFLAQAVSRFQHEAEAPTATLVRLGINAERLLIYLAGFQNQLASAAPELAGLLARGEQDEALLRIERLQAGCVTLGLHGAAAQLREFEPGQLSASAVDAVLADVTAAAAQQSALVRQASASD
jgi:two-component system chemotaxis response regulator CheY